MRLRKARAACPPEWAAAIPPLLILAALAGCGNAPSLDDPVLAGVPVSAALAPELEAGIRTLAEPAAADPAAVAALRLRGEILQGLYGKALRAETAERFLALWAADPGHILWSNLALWERRNLDARERIREIRSLPAINDSTTAQGCYNLGWLSRSRAGYRQHFGRARELSGGLEPLQALWIELDLAWAERRNRNWDEARSLLLDLLPRARRIGGWRLEALVWQELAEVGAATAELDDALHAATLADTMQALAADEDGVRIGRLWSRLLKADILAARRDRDAALALYEINTAEARELDLHSLPALGLNKAGMLAESLGDRELGIRLCRRTLAFAAADRDSANLPGLIMNLARRFRMTGRLDSCRVYRERAIRTAQAYPRFSYHGHLALMLARYPAQLGDFATVDSLLQVAVADSASATTADARAELHLELIRGWMETDRPDLIYRSIQAIADLREGMGDAFADRHVTADLNLAIGEFLIERGEYLEAARSLELAAAALERRSDAKRSWTLARHRGVLARERGDLVTAEAMFRECIRRGGEIRSPEKETEGRFLLGSVLLAQGRHAEARDVCPPPAGDRFAGRFTTRVSVLILTADSHAREGDPATALAVLVEARDACRPWTPPGLTGRVDLETARTLTRLGRADEARVLLARLADELDDDLAPDTPVELAYFNGDLKRDLVEALIALPDADPAYTLAVARRVLPGWRAAGAAAPLQTPQLVYFTGEERSGRWTVTDDGVEWRPLPDRQELDGLLTLVLADLGNPARAGDAGGSNRLAEALLAGVDGIWSPERPLLLVPDGEFHGIPWAALPLPGTDGTVLDHGPIAVGDSPVPRSDRAPIHRPAGRLLVIGANGHRNLGAAGLRTLRHAEREAREIAAVWPADRATLRLGADAAGALSADADLAAFESIHVSSHAVVYAGRSDRTMILLPGEGAAALTANAIRELNLEAEMVFLSCCEAGDGRGLRSGYTGLARGFIRAGARHVVAPPIAVDDEAARHFAIRFHRRWLEGLAVPAALAAAQRDLRDGDPRWAHPFYWAWYQVIQAAVER